LQAESSFCLSLGALPRVRGYNVNQQNDDAPVDGEKSVFESVMMERGGREEQGRE